MMRHGAVLDAVVNLMTCMFAAHVPVSAMVGDGLLDRREVAVEGEASSMKHQLAY